ncbi:conserved hypothetical protein [Leishmania major strain Friedlin]|uniref:SRP9 domain-containing protein n=1 Tax=Leishmania major TaxID=5664 RepID=E9ACA3_LEIMA|nr:conserved hypothetical protein [Leishmania major strain Friedlin]CAG9567179.1 hypothetical_protein_-_conserved [Leishmania major strain Friedlin]CBZ11918.1 conserved hypothetical protein [Leishmania major strain Friedlin]|eukprot:XP_003721634.1 conserved hypothetical protein [Leishmania major strain Friedlin]
MRLELKDFVQATRSMHQQPGGVRRTRLMLRLRPYQSRKTFVLKATDGRVTMTTRVEHQGHIKMVESLVNEFVTECTRASVGSPVPSTATASAGEQQAASAAAMSSISAASGHKGRSPGAAAAAAAATGQAGASGSASHRQQTQLASAQASSHSSGNAGRQGKGRKGKRH